MNFYEDQITKQVDWWKLFSSQPDWADTSNEPNWGKWGGKPYKHIIPANDWQELLWTELKTGSKLDDYLGKKKKQKHSGVSNLLSSWICSANLYFPVHLYPEFKVLMLAFLKEKISDSITELIDAELEFSLGGELSPAELLGEKGGSNGRGQTSPDVAFIVKTNSGDGLILTECKYTEHGFYSCSARTTKDSEGKPHNPAPKKCMQAAALCSYEDICNQTKWERKYLDNFKLSKQGKELLTRCPAATSGYQLMRQQALANGIKKSGKFDLVISSVSFDRRNTDLTRCLSSTGIADFCNDWSKIYEKGVGFVTWHHQDWVEYVRKHSTNEVVNDWLKYLEDRYGY